MATTTEDFEDILSFDKQIDMQRLRYAARHGVPDCVRGRVWKYLLGVQGAKRTNVAVDLIDQADLRNGFDVPNEILKSVRGEAGRYSSRRNDAKPKVHDLKSTLERVVTAYLRYNRHVQYSPALVHMCGPFAYSFSQEAEIYTTFSQLLGAVDEYFTKETLKSRTAKFFMLFKIAFPDLHDHFEEEDVDVRCFAFSWLQYFFAKELSPDSLCRLWDTYFSTSEGLDQHVYMCLSLLSYFRDALMDMEESEIKSLLSRFPCVDMDVVIAQAEQLRSELEDRNIM